MTKVERDKLMDRARKSKYVLYVILGGAIAGISGFLGAAYTSGRMMQFELAALGMVGAIAGIVIQWAMIGAYQEPSGEVWAVIFVSVITAIALMVSLIGFLWRGVPAVMIGLVSGYLIAKLARWIQWRINEWRLRYLERKLKY